MGIIDASFQHTRTENNILWNNKADVHCANQNILNWLLCIGIISYTPLVVLSFVVSSYASMRTSYLIMLLTLLITLFFHKKFLIRIPSTALLYINYGILMTIVTLTSSLITNDSVSAMILLFLFQMPIVILDKSWRVTTFELFFAFFYITFILLFKPPALIVDECVNVCAVTVISLILGRHLRKTQLDNFDLKRQALIRESTDTLTGLYNRRKLFEFFEQCETSNSQTPITGVVMIDIDNFKLYNDSYGHQAGDKCLRQVCNCFRLLAQSFSVTFYRYGGEEFVGVTCKYNSKELFHLCEKLNTMVYDLQLKHDCSETFFVTVSIGAASTEGQIYPGYDQLLTQADKALYSAKRNGKNRTVLFSPDKPF